MFTVLAANLTTLQTYLSIIAAVIAISTPIISLIIRFVHRLKLKVFFTELFGNDKNELHRFKHYVKHTFSQKVGQSEQTLTFKQFLLQAQNSKIVIITGSAGIGKTMLMKRLAYLNRIKYTKNSPRVLEDYGIVFRKLRSEVSLESMLADLKQSSAKGCTLFLDGLDELGDLKTKTGSAVLNELLQNLQRDLVPNCSRIFISLRPEILEEGCDLLSTDGSIQIFNVQNFNYQQIMAMCRSEAHNNNGGQSSSTRKVDVAKLKAVLHNNPQSVFCYPLILTWANDILAEYSAEELRYLSWYDALGKVIQKELEREYNVYNQKIVGSANAAEKARFIGESKKFLCEIAQEMALNNTLVVSRDKVVQNHIVQNFNAREGETTGVTFVSRRLLRATYTSGEERLEFIHNTIFWRVLADVVLNKSTDQSTRVQIISACNKFSWGNLLLDYCRQGLWSIHRDKHLEIFTYKTYMEYIRAISNKRVRCCDCSQIPGEILLTCFSDCEVILNQGLLLSAAVTSKFVSEGVLDLTNNNISSLGLIVDFSQNSYSTLICKNNPALVVAEVPDFVQNICFDNCTNLQSVHIPQNATLLNNAFNNCKALTEVDVPRVKYQFDNANNAFNNCTSLKRVYLSQALQHNIGRPIFSSIGRNTDGIVLTVRSDVLGLSAGLFSNKESYSTPLEPAKIKEVVFEEGSKCKCINECAFYKIASLKTIDFPPVLKAIGNDAFCGCSELKSIILPPSLIDIGANAFADCVSLKDIALPKNITCIMRDAFKNTAYYNNPANWKDGVLYLGNYLIKARSDISGVCKIKEGTTLIADSAFCNCESLTGVVIPGSVKYIGMEAFEKCSSLKSISLPEGVSVGRYAFAQCVNLSSISLPQNVTNIGASAFEDTAFFNDKANWQEGVLYIGQHLIRASKDIAPFYKIKDGTKTIASEAFTATDKGFCYIPFDNLRGITIPQSVTSIFSYAFNWCSNLEKVNLSVGLLDIGYMAFGNCSSLKSIVLPSGLKKLNACIFGECAALSEVRFNGTVDEWNNLQKTNWQHSPVINKYFPASQVICLDGMVEILH